VTAILPPYVAWLGKTSPSSEDLSFDANSGTVTWNVGKVSPYTADIAKRKEVFFQVSLQPSVDQITTAPILVNQAVLSATDAWTNAAISSSQGFLTSSFSTDPTYKNGYESVIAGK
jgi:hypothetical protein